MPKMLPRLMYTLLTGALLITFGYADMQMPAFKLTDDLAAGLLLVKDDTPGYYKEIPKLDTDVNIRIDGMAVTATIDQVYTNNNPMPIEAIYVFPLPETAAINEMQIIVGDRFIQGIVKERDEAKKTYEKAKKEGKRAALTEQERPNIFTNSIANIMPGDTIIVRLKYVDVVHYDHGRFTFRFPTVVGPRYIPGNRIIGYSGNGWSFDSDVVPDASRITPPVLPETKKTGNMITFTIELNTGLELEHVESPSHKINMTDTAEGEKQITLSNTSDIPNRDFILNYTAKTGNIPEAALFSATKGDEDYFMLMTIPPKITETNPLPKEIIFIMDISGSMAGESIYQAKEGLKTAVAALNRDDYFNIITFNDKCTYFQPGHVLATNFNKTQANQFISKQDASGGTAALPAIEAGYYMAGRKDAVAMIFFMTDGSVGNEDELLRTIKSGSTTQNIRFFPIGIGSAPNSFLLRKASEYGKGTFTYISTVGSVESKMMELFKLVYQPVFTNVSLYIDGEKEIYPNPIPDLFQGQPLVIFGKLKGKAKDVTLRGKTSQGYVSVNLPLDLENAGKEPGIPTLWARKKISGLMDSYRLGDKSARQEVINLAVEHSLLTKFTSFVAVEDKIANYTKELATIAIPTDMPKGWRHGAVFNKMNHKGLMLVNNTQSSNSRIQFVSLPQTATSYPLQFIIGLVLILTSLLLKRYFWMKKT
ncbi:MAG: marine proteobacterial sortase target protein [Candidatus Marinimicrobia bacterium]|nr:marine proteobacterial sortase target protein [Candidatus Neomarinimicrobiota bacterium]MBL7047235.1 marine proteobacterial sortase target protein [Candidatus Neomarinimicrobiota bacterium]MBL7110066.1 marine proteobacterial sortase target protein [Candidatus Neomarinimicrobiota bacterium]